MSTVWWARHELTGRDVALKLSPSSGDIEHTTRFIREAGIIGRFQHRNIVNVLDAGELEEEGYHFLAMELLRGSPFSDRLEAGEPLRPEDVLPILIEVCKGLEVAHASGVIHRDIKPENIFLAMVPGEGVVPKIVDFGISKADDALAKITADGQILGTPAYMAPEQALGRLDITPAVDIWAIGVILQEAITGKQPFGGTNHHALLKGIVDDPPAPLPPGVDPGLRAIIERCLQKDPHKRFADAASLRAALEDTLARLRSRDVTTTLVSPQIVPDVGRLQRFRGAVAERSSVIAVAVPLAASVALAIFAPRSEPRPPELRPRVAEIARKAASQIPRDEVLDLDEPADERARPVKATGPTPPRPRPQRH